MNWQFSLLNHHASFISHNEGACHIKQFLFNKKATMLAVPAVLQGTPRYLKLTRDPYSVLQMLGENEDKPSMSHWQPNSVSL